MPGQIAIFAVRPSESTDQLSVEDMLSSRESVTIPAGYQNFIPIAVNGDNYLIACSPTSDHLSFYRFFEKSPWLAEMPAKSRVGSGRDIVEPFLLGNRPHVLCYSREDGVFELFSVADDLSISLPYRFFRNHEPGVTKGFTTLKPFTCRGTVVFLGYNGDDGHVALYTLSVTATSPAGTPPLLLTNVWSHQWAKGWTRFAFFQFGGANFFLKTNTLRPNVNIDHILDNLADGTCEIASHLDLEDAQELDLVEPFSLGHGDPYFIAYKKNGQASLNRFYSDCTGWARVGSFSAKSGAGHVIPVNTENQSRACLLFY